MTKKFVRYIKRPGKEIPSRLAHLDIELTERCNNNCIHCCINLPENDGAARAREMKTEQVKNILKEAADLGCLQVRFTGGEPLLRPDFETLYVSARRLGMKVIIFTNARLITEPLADLFASIPPLVTMEVSVYGMHADSYEAVTRAPGSFVQFRQGLDRLLERNVPFVVKTALLPPNRHESEEFESFCGTIPWMDSSPQYSMFFDLRLRRDDPKKNRLIKSLRVNPAEALEVMTQNPEEFRKGMEEFAARFMGPPGERLFRCYAGRALCIDAYGRAQPCIGLRAPELTADVVNTPEGSLKAALDIFTGLKEMRAGNPEYLERCAVCFLKGVCEQCPAKSWSEAGMLDKPVEYLCAVAHAQARWMGWLGDNENAWEVRKGEKNRQKKAGRKGSDAGGS